MVFEEKKRGAFPNLAPIFPEHCSFPENQGGENGVFGKLWFCLRTPAIFVIFVGFRVPRSATPCFCGQNVNRHFRRFSSKPPVFGRGQKTPVSKNTVSQP